jgi:asparagine synthase (glutamine-hydrolysing)
MGYIAAAINKHGKDTSQTILQMLRAASPRPALSIGIADHKNSENSKSPDFTSHEGPILLGSKNVFSSDYPPAPLHQGNHSMVFKGILLDTQEPDSLSAANTLFKNPVRGVERLISERTGAYAVAAVTENSVVAGVDYIGTVPLYYGENKDTGAIASNKKMLWAIGIEPFPLKPGQLIRITEKETRIHQIRALQNPVSSASTVEALHQIMTRTSEEYADKTPRATVAFSGGIDSLLTAYYLQQNNVRLELIWSGLEKQREPYIAQEAADHLGIKLHVDTHTPDEVDQMLDNIIASIEEPDPVKTGIAYPFHWASSKTRELGYTTMYSGNGADELFGGYMKYLEKYLSGGDPSEDLYSDVANSYLNNFHRDTKTCLDQDIRLLLPFTHPRLVDYALSIPITQKIPDNREQPRKKILRELARSLDIPEKLAYRPKKAAQYSSGVNKALSQIAKKKGMNLRTLTNLRYDEWRKDLISRE